jgi:hypothetical protein
MTEQVQLERGAAMADYIRTVQAELLREDDDRGGDVGGWPPPAA